MSIQIRPFQKSDRDALQSLFAVCQERYLPGLLPGGLEDLAEATRGEPILVAVENDEPIGFVSWWPPSDFIHNLFVRPDRFRRGVGTALLQACLAEMGRPARLKCLRDNQRAIEFYLSQGWRIGDPGEGPRGRYYWMVLENLGASNDVR